MKLFYLFPKIKLSGVPAIRFSLTILPLRKNVKQACFQYLLFDPPGMLNWQNHYFSNTAEIAKRSAIWGKLMADTFNAFNSYQLPIIILLNSTPKEAVCQVFENVNTGGVTLTVFELLTASFCSGKLFVAKRLVVSFKR